MSLIKRSAQAEDDLVEIATYIAKDSVTAAERWLDKIERTLRHLADAPGTGAEYPELRPNLRCFPLGVYLIFYRSIEGGIEVVRVIHGARDIYSIFGVGQ
ncbi:MAG: type II toxin-antitoxin system RelE/ParE family toxin [Planctomycetes bacterium]|nr:type II toxin-antitoxin system RelE/ParE family toxin [Planctomycetota bacterium]